MKPEELTNEDILNISQNVCCPYYHGNLEATLQMIEEIADMVKPEYLLSSDDYIRAYDGSFYTYKTWVELVESEKEQGVYALSQDELKSMIGSTIRHLENGWYLQRV